MNLDKLFQDYPKYDTLWCRALQDFKSSLGPLGSPVSFIQTGQRERGGMLERVFRVVLKNRILRVWTYQMSNGKLEQYQVAPQS